MPGQAGENVMEDSLFLNVAAYSNRLASVLFLLETLSFPISPGPGQHIKR